MDRDDLLVIAKERGVRIADMLALAYQNDPFNCGTPSQKIAAQWFADIWSKYYSDQRGIHLRRIHYRLINLEPPELMPDDEPYRNTDKCWKYMLAAGKYARYLFLVDAFAFKDRRNPPPIINAQYMHERPYTSISPGGYLPDLDDIMDIPDRLDLPELNAAGYDDVFPGYHVEVWAEKTTMNDVLEPVCGAQRVNLVTGAGELSITAALAFLRRLKSANRPGRILYISDFDPAGLGMPISIARKLEYWQHKQDELAALDIRLLPVVLTLDQVKEYRLPRTPIKESDMRKGRWIEDYGAGAVELDALEANHPGKLARIVRRAIRPYRDDDMPRRARATRTKLQDELNDITEKEQARTGDEMLQAEYEALKDELQAAIGPYSRRWHDIMNRLSGVNVTLSTALEDAIGDIDMRDYPLPDPELPEEPPALYDSRRDYMTQLSYYKHHRHNGAE